MNNRVQEAFSAIRAESGLKERTLERIYAPKRRHRGRPLAMAAACLAVVLFLGGGVFFTPVSAIGIEINPSLKLRINCFDMVVGVEGLNEDGRRIAENTQLIFSEYSNAIDILLNSSELKGYLEEGREMDIYVECGDEQRCGRMLERVEGCVGGCGNITCRAGNGHGHHYGRLEGSESDEDGVDSGDNTQSGHGCQQRRRARHRGHHSE